MIKFIRSNVLLVAAAMLLLGVRALAPSIATAQTPPATDAACPAPPSPDQIQQLQAQDQQAQTQFAQDLAQALGLPLATVQQALNAPAADAPLQMQVPLPNPPPDPIAAAAAQLGVTADQLKAAVQAADKTLPFAAQTADGSSCLTVSGPPAGGANVDTTAFYSAVAQSLGQNLTGQQVESAFVSTLPTPPDPAQIQSVLQQRLGDLATALGVSTDALTAAFKSMATSGACLPPGAFGGDVQIHSGVSGPATIGGAQALPANGSGAVVIGTGPLPVGGSDSGSGVIAVTGGPVGGSTSGPVTLAAPADGSGAIFLPLPPGPGPSASASRGSAIEAVFGLQPCSPPVVPISTGPASTQPAP